MSMAWRSSGAADEQWQAGGRIMNGAEETIGVDAAATGRKDWRASRVRTFLPDASQARLPHAAGQGGDSDSESARNDDINPHNRLGAARRFVTPAPLTHPLANKHRLLHFVHREDFLQLQLRPGLG